MQTPPHHHRRRVASTLLAATVATAAITLTACGSDESSATSSAPADPVSTGAATATEAASATGATDVDGSTVREVITDSMGADGDAVDEVLGSMSAESRFSIVVEQIDPVPALEIDGTTIRFVFDSGTVQDAVVQCMVGGTFLEPGESLTIVYPDGETTC